MRQFGVVEHQPVTHFLVKEGQVCEEQVLKVVHETLLNTAIESLAVGVHFGCLGIGLPVHEVVTFHALGKVPLELAAVVGECLGSGVVRERLRDCRMQSCCVHTARTGWCVGKGHVCFGINGCQYVALDAVALAHDGVKRQTLQGLEVHSLGLAGDGSTSKAFALAFGVGAPGAGAQLVWCAGNHASDGADAGQRKVPGFAKRDKFGKHLFFAKVGGD